MSDDRVTIEWDRVSSRFDFDLLSLSRVARRYNWVTLPKGP